MNIFRTIRVALTLSLIVTMLVQPMVAVALAAGCGDFGCQQSAKAACEGCGCCEASDSNEPCCCCRESEKADAQAPTNGREADEEPSEMEVALAQGVCLCGVSSPPMDRGANRDRGIERSELRVTCMPRHMEHNGELRWQPGQSRFLAACGKIPHFSQRLLCVWRI